jgi:hypothetical protein
MFNIVVKLSMNLPLLAQLFDLGVSEWLELQLLLPDLTNRHVVFFAFPVRRRTIDPFSLECMAGTTGLQPATSAVTETHLLVTNRKYAIRMAF